MRGYFTQIYNSISLVNFYQLQYYKTLKYVELELHLFRFTLLKASLISPTYRITKRDDCICIRIIFSIYSNNNTINGSK